MTFLISVLTAGVFSDSSAADQRFPVLWAGGVSYTNALVTGKTAKDIFIRHSGGLATLRVSDLDSSTRSALGISTNTPNAAASTVSSTNRFRGVLGALADLGHKAEQKHRELLEEDNDGPAPIETPTRMIARWVAAVVFLSMVILYFPFCLSCSRLCRRAGAPSSFLVWLPGFKRLALFKATNVSRLWFFVGIVIPFVGACAWILCCLRLCEMFHRTRWFLLLMLLPFFGWFVFMYLDRVSRDEDSDPAVRSQDRIRLAA